MVRSVYICSMTPSPRFYRKGFRLGSNTLVLLFVFFLVGLFLHYGGRTKPVVSFWNDVKQILGIGHNPRDPRDGSNPYKAPEPNVASDDRTSQASDEASDNGRSSAGSRAGGGVPRPNTPGKPLFAFEKLVDFILPAYTDEDRVAGSELIRHDGYTLRFRDEYKLADWVAYPLLPEEINGETEREGSSFKPDPDVPTGTALPTDYTHSGYDRGHLAPAGDFKFSRRMMQQTFYMSNVTPQAPQFNRGIWKELEEKVRTWAIQDEGLYVVTGPVLKPGLPTIGRQNQVAVPEQFYKVILYCNQPDIRMIAFLLNNEPSHEPLSSFVISVDELERITGIDFFPKLPDDLERPLESQRPPVMVAQWFTY